MTEFTYNNPTLDALDEAALDDALAQDAARPRGYVPLPKGRYTAYLTDWGTETVDHESSPLCGQCRQRATFETEHDGRQRKLFLDFTIVPAKWPAANGKPEGYVREFVLAGQLTKALGLRGKPFDQVLEAARTTPVDLEVGIDRKKPDRNVVYAIHSQVAG